MKTMYWKFIFVLTLRMLAVNALVRLCEGREGRREECMRKGGMIVGGRNK